MGYYQIRNITTELGKRHIKVNTTQYVEMSNNFATEKIAISPGAEILLESSHLPMSVHKLRSEKLVSVVELDKNSFEKKRSALQSPQITENKVVEEEMDAESKTKRLFAKSTKKEN